MIRPRELPRIRDRLARLLGDPTSPLRSQVREGEEGYSAVLAQAAQHLRVAELFWASEEMSALAVSAGQTLPEVAVDERPAPAGLLVCDGGIGQLTYRGLEIPVDALSWGPAPAGLLTVWWTARSRLDQALQPHGVRVDPTVVPPLVPVGGHALPGAPQPAEQVDPQVRTVVLSLAAAWALMRQPTLVEQRTTTATTAIRRAYQRAGRPAPEVTLVTLRRAYLPRADADRDESTEAGRRFRHRWVVRGHWRHQPYGPKRGQRRLTWIPAYIKGPAGAPLLATEKVNVWRR